MGWQDHIDAAKWDPEIDLEYKANKKIADDNATEFANAIKENEVLLADRDAQIATADAKIAALTSSGGGAADPNGGGDVTDDDDNDGEEDGATSITTFATVVVASVYALVF